MNDPKRPQRDTPSPLPLDRDRYEDARAISQRPRLPIHLVLDNLRSGFNVGSIIRTSEAAHIARLHLCGITVQPPHPQIARTALGATRYMPWTHHPRTVDAVEALRADGCRIVAVELTPESRSYLEVDYPLPLALVLGHEVRGVAPEVLELCDEIVSIPMRGVKNSINVATSWGIVIFEILRRLRPDLHSPDPSSAGD